MIQILRVIGLSILLLLIGNNSMKASHCYSYTLKAYFELIAEGDSIYFQQTIKDHNEITYVSQKKILLNDVPNKNFSIICDKGNAILFVADGNYYLVKTNMYEVENYGVNKLFPIENVTQIVSNCFFLISGKWHYVVAENYSDKIIDKILPSLTSDLEIMMDYNRGELLLKDSQKVYVFYQNKYLLKPIPNLIPSTTTFKESNDYYGMHFLYDDDTFYLTDIRFNYQDITSGFNIFDKYNDFTKFEFVINNNTSLDTQDGLIWMYISGGKTLDNGKTVFFYPLKASYLNSYRDLYLYEGNIYNSNWDAINKYRPLDASCVKDLNTLHTDGYSPYSDNQSFYKLNYDQNSLSTTESSERNISRIDSIKEANTTDIKSFSLAYAYDNKLFIENKEIENIANKEKLEFIGSTVNIINACDSDSFGKNRELTSVIVQYYYFFKDDLHIYSYQSGDNNLKIMNDLLPNNYRVDNYDDLVLLTAQMTTHTVET